MGDHPQHLMIGGFEKWVIKISLRNICNHLVFVSQVEHNNVQKALVNDYWLMAMHKELNQFKRNNVWTLVPKLDDHTIIGTRWVFRNKLDEHGIIIKNKARLVGGLQSKRRYRLWWNLISHC